MYPSPEALFAGMLVRILLSVNPNTKGESPSSGPYARILTASAYVMSVSPFSSKYPVASLYRPHIPHAAFHWSMKSCGGRVHASAAASNLARSAAVTSRKSEGVCPSARKRRMVNVGNMVGAASVMYISLLPPPFWSL